VKLFHGQTCKAGSIIVRQRGTKWRTGDNVGLGKDHTIFALCPGRVRFHRDEATKRMHAGVLPATVNSVRQLHISLADPLGSHRHQES
jgi:large subunit ribosomal protein L27